jgi:hypothetical protein
VRYVFDIDGTLSARPDVFGPLMAALVKDGHDVVVLTGAVGPPGSIPGWRLAQLRALGLEAHVHFTECQIACGRTTDEVGQMKGDFCRETGAALMVEDTDAWITSIRARSPETLCLLMRAS